jgi:peptidoglycan/xylan/chitin deacetylase (PgdA/CDA1 family)
VSEILTSYAILPTRFRPLSSRRLLFALLLAGLACSWPGYAESVVPAPIRFLLTFDDGPSAARASNPTALVLDTLQNNDLQAGIKALFFLQTRSENGGASDIGQQLIRREHAEGHALGFHTATPHHSNHRSLDEAVFERSLQDGVADLTAITGNAPALVRPPYWNYDARTLAAYQMHGMRLLLTDLSANDGKTIGFNASWSKHRNMLKQLGEVKQRWQSGAMAVVDGTTPVVVTFHDLNTYTAAHLQEYLHILVEVAGELEMPTAPRPFYSDAAALERAALASTVRDGDVRARLPGLWNWLWQ